MGTLRWIEMCVCAKPAFAISLHQLYMSHVVSRNNPYLPGKSLLFTLKPVWPRLQGPTVNAVVVELLQGTKISR